MRRVFADRTPLLVAGTYILVSIAYIAGSDRLVEALSVDVASLSLLQTGKGLGFVLATGGLLYALLAAMAGRLGQAQRESDRSRQALIAADRQAMSSFVASSVAHDLNNLLLIISLTAATVLDERVSAEERRQDADSARQALERAVGLVQRLRDLSASAPEPPREIDVLESVRATLAMLRVHAAVRGCAVSLECDEPAMRFWASGSLLEQALMNLVLNAAEAAGVAGRILIRVYNEGNKLVIEVHDDGPGVPAEQRQAVFEPLFTTKTTGTGLGLLVVRACAQAHGGRAEVEPSPLGGACFRLSLPMDRSAPGPRVAAELRAAV